MKLLNFSICQKSNITSDSSICLPYFFLIGSFGINLVLGFPAHCYILWLSMKELIRGQSVEVFIFNTSLIEVVFSISFPFAIKQYFLNCPECKYITIVFALVLVIGRPLFQTCTCVERYIGVLHPVTFMKVKPMKYRISIAIIGWILIICSGLLSLCTDINNVLLPEYITFLSTKVFCCLKVLKALKRPGPGEDVKKKDAVSQDKVKAFRIIRIVLVSAVLTYGPIVIWFLLYLFMDDDIVAISLTMCWCSGIMLGFVQPLLYLRRIKSLCLCFNY